MKKKIIVLVLSLFPFFLFAQSEALKFTETMHDFGTIKEEGGRVTHVFEFENQGKIPIIINAVQASCGCTTPVWTKEPVLPGKNGIIKVTYNPINRPNKFIKTVSVTTNLGKQQLMIKGFVTPRPKTLAELYPKRMEQLRLTTSYVMFNEIGNKQEKKIAVDIVNDSNENITVSFGKMPAYVTVFMKDKKLKSKQKSTIEVTYNAEKTNFWGFNSDIIPIYVNDVVKSSNSLVVTATVIEDFSKMTKEDKEKAPSLGVDKFETQFQSVVNGDKVKIQFKLTNIGKQPLVLRKIDASSDALEVKPSKTVIAPNAQETLDVVFDTKGKRGYQNQQITIITNAPDLPVVNFRISGIVE